MLTSTCLLLKPLVQMNVQFINNLSSNDAVPAHTHDHGNGSHTHGGPGDHGHTHEILEHPGTNLRRRCSLQSFKLRAGKYHERDLPDYSNRNFEERGFTVGIGGYDIYCTGSL